LLLVLNIVNALSMTEHKRLRNPNLLNRLHQYQVNNLIKFDQKLPMECSLLMKKSFNFRNKHSFSGLLF
jgi:hypothetical protein